MVDDERRAVLRRRYLSLGLGEFAAAVVFTGLGELIISPRLSSLNEVIAFWSALIPLLFVLVQAGAYWLLARSWVERSPMPSVLAVLFRALRIVTLITLGVGLAGIVLWWPENFLIAIGVVALWCFGLIEYVNYYVVRLAYPPSQWLARVGEGRQPRLARDIRPA